MSGSPFYQRGPFIISGYILTVIGTLLATIAYTGPAIRQAERREIAAEIADYLQGEGATIPNAKVQIEEGDVRNLIASALEQVRDVQGTFELSNGKSKELTDHLVLFTQDVASGRVAIVYIDGERARISVGQQLKLPNPADNCHIELVEVRGREGIYKLRCFSPN